MMIINLFDSLGVQHISKEIKKIIENKNIVTNVYRLQAYDSMMWEYFFVLDLLVLCYEFDFTL